LNVAPFDLQKHSDTEQVPAAIVVTQDVTALKETERLKDDFIGIAAHELRNPLAILKGYAQTLIVQTARGNGPELADWQVEALQSIDQSSLRLVELIDDLLDVTRLQAGRLELHPEPTNLIALAKRTISRLQVTTAKHTLSLHTSLEYLVLNIDAQRIEQVLSNIISNAIKYSPEGGPIEISISVDSKKNMALLSISDHGIGIPVNQQAHVFARFMRADNARLYGIGGTGLGLYISRELVDRHGGRIWFESAEAQGTTFYIALPKQHD
jgi:signal transduction histidine kinase